MALAAIIPIPGASLVAAVGIGLYELYGYIKSWITTPEDKLWETIEDCYSGYTFSWYETDNKGEEAGEEGAVAYVNFISSIVTDSQSENVSNLALKLLTGRRNVRLSKKSNKKLMK